MEYTCPICKKFMSKRKSRLNKEGVRVCLECLNKESNKSDDKEKDKDQ